MKKYYNDVIILVSFFIVLIPPTIFICFDDYLKLIFCVLYILIITIFIIKMAGIPIDILFRIKNYINKKTITQQNILELNVHDIFVKKINGKSFDNYYYFYYKSIWKDPETSIEYTFRSLPYKTERFSKKISKIKKVKVFINKKNPKKYYMQITE